MPRYQLKNPINSSQNNMSSHKLRNPTTTSTEYFNIAKVQEKDIKTACMYMTEVHKQEINESL